MSDVTLILSHIESGDPTAANQILPLVYDELRKLAASKLAHEKPGHTLQATALVHEAYIRLVDVAQAQHWNSRGHFFGAAAEAMRRILVDQARRNKAVKRGGKADRLECPLSDIVAPCAEQELLAVDDVLERLEQVDSVAATLVKLRFFAGLTMADTAAAMGISVRSAHDIWAYARAWLHQKIRGD